MTAGTAMTAASFFALHPKRPNSQSDYAADDEKVSQIHAGTFFRRIFMRLCFPATCERPNII